MTPTDTLTPLPSGPVTSIAEAVSRMETIAGLLPPQDGLACFNRMYLLVTRAVLGQVTDGFFADPGFMQRLDVDFVNRYLGAIDAYRANPPAASRSWSVLLSARSDPGIAPLQFALAGMNAHINFDLAQALVSTCQDRNVSLDTGSQHADYEKINQTLADLDQQVRESFETGDLLQVDRATSGLTNLAGSFSIQAARETAWVNAQVLWRLRDERFFSDPYLDGLDRSVAFSGRVLLTPLGAL